MFTSKLELMPFTFIMFSISVELVFSKHVKLIQVQLLKHVFIAFFCMFLNLKHLCDWFSVLSIKLYIKLTLVVSNCLTPYLSPPHFENKRESALFKVIIHEYRPKVCLFLTKTISNYCRSEIISKKL